MNKLEAASFVGRRSLTGNLSRFLDNQRRYGRHAAWEKSVAQAAPTAPSFGTNNKSPTMFKTQAMDTARKGVAESRCANNPACATMDASTTGEPTARTLR